MQVSEQSVTSIDIGSIIRARAKGKARYIPSFLIKFLEKFIHQDFINAYLKRGLVGVPFCKGVLEYLNVTVEVEGLENLPAGDCKCTFVSNHPLGAIDGVTLGWVIGEHYDGKIKYLVNDLLMNLKGLAPLCLPINKLGKQARNFPAMVDEAFGGDNHVIMFPAGLCSRRQKDGTIRDIPWNKAFLKKSIQTKRDIVPVYFIGYNSNRFYNVAQWCKRLHLPNFAMALLPDEMYRSQGGHYTVRFGKPISWQTFDKSKTMVEWARWVQDTVYKL